MNRFDIYWYNFIFDEDSTKPKCRPVIVLDTDVILPIAKITSHKARTSKDYEIINWKEAGLSKPSVIRFDKIQIIKQSALLESNYIGHLSEEDIYELKRLNLITESINEDLTEEEQKQADAIVKFIDDLYKLRQESITKDGEYGIGNLVFKEIRNRGILDKLKDKLRELTSKELSLESLEEDK